MLVSCIEPGGPAEKAGLRVGDAIQRLGDKLVLGSGDLPALIGQALPGERTLFGLWRQGKPLELGMLLGDASDKMATVAQADPVAGARVGWAWPGLACAEPRRAAQASTAVCWWSGRSKAWRALAGLQRGGVLLAINGVQVNDLARLQAAVARAKKPVALPIQCDGDQIFAPVWPS